MPVWPFFMGFAAFLTIWGAWRGVWIAPALALAGYVCVRCVVGLEYPAKELAISAVWLVFAFGLCYYKAWLPGVLFCLSALTYPPFVLMGKRLDYMGGLAITADVLGGLALLAIFAGLLGLSNMAGDRSGGYSDRSGIVASTPGIVLWIASASRADR